LVFENDCASAFVHSQAGVYGIYVLRIFAGCDYACEITLEAHPSRWSRTVVYTGASRCDLRRIAALKS
jgi:hypothetical protein